MKPTLDVFDKRKDIRSRLRKPRYILYAGVHFDIPKGFEKRLVRDGFIQWDNIAGVYRVSLDHSLEDVQRYIDAQAG